MSQFIFPILVVLAVSLPEVFIDPLIDLYYSVVRPLFRRKETQ